MKAKYKYNRGLGYQVRKCQVCGKILRCCQHHIASGSKRGASPIIWVCVMDHARIHNPASFNLPITWAYDNGYLIRNLDIYKKKMKKCSHGKTYFSAEKKCVVCQYCGSEMKDHNLGKQKTLKPIKKKSGKLKGMSSRVCKMGQEKQRQVVVKAENLKRKLYGLRLKMKYIEKAEGRNSIKYIAIKKLETLLVVAMREFERKIENNT